MKAVIVDKVKGAFACLRMPPSKSITHRALTAAALADGTSVIRQPGINADTEATINCLERLGACFTRGADTVAVKGLGAGHIDFDGRPIYCAESASTLRFLLPLFAQSGKRCVFTGSGRLMERPEDVYEQSYSRRGEFIRVCGSELTECFSDHLKDSLSGYICVKGKLRPDVYTIRGDISSQFASGLMFLLPLLGGDSAIRMIPPVVSEPYVRLTADVLRLAGINTEYEKLPSGAVVISIPGKQRYRAFSCSVDGDWSSAAFFEALAAVTNKKIRICGLDLSSGQPDKTAAELIRSFGAQVRENEAQKTDAPAAEKDEFSEGSPVSYITVSRRGARLKAIEADISDCPDLGPVLFALATQAQGISTFHGASRLRGKESDRIACMESELRKLGCRMASSGDTVWVEGRTAIQGGTVLDGCGDHRIVMALSVLACCAKEPVTIEGAEAVSKSYPGFFEDLAACGVSVEIAD